MLGSRTLEGQASGESHLPVRAVRTHRDARPCAPVAPWPSPQHPWFSCSVLGSVGNAGEALRRMVRTDSHWRSSWAEVSKGVTYGG